MEQPRKMTQQKQGCSWPSVEGGQYFPCPYQEGCPLLIFHWATLVFPFSFLARLIFIKGGINSLMWSRCDPPSRSNGIVMGYQILKVTLKKRSWPQTSLLETSLQGSFVGFYDLQSYSIQMLNSLVLPNCASLQLRPLDRRVAQGLGWV